MEYGPQVDTWALGCILAELYSSKPLFPGENELDVIAMIMEILDVPPLGLVENAAKFSDYFDPEGNPYLYTNRKGKRRLPGQKTLKQLIDCDDLHLLNFIERCLDWNPRSRITPEEMLRHDYLESAAQRMLPSALKSGGKAKS